MSTKYITLRGLLLLVGARPRLEYVDLCLDARVVSTSGAGMDTRSTTVTLLSCPGSPINDPRLVAMFLLKHFSMYPFGSAALSRGHTRRGMVPRGGAFAQDVLAALMRGTDRILFITCPEGKI